MRARWLQTLRFQVTLVLLVVLALFAAATTYTFLAISQHRNDNLVLNLAGKLQLSAQHLADQGMNYKENAPRDYPTYYRDLHLYYRDLMAHVGIFDRIIGAFMDGVLPPDLTGLDHVVNPVLDDRAMGAVSMLEATWKTYRSRLMEALGEDRAEPRLEYAAEHTIEQRKVLETAANRMLEEFQRMVSGHFEQINRINRLVLVLSLGLVVLILVWFHRQILSPLNRAVSGFRQVAQGDFGHQLPVTADNELGWMTEAFNRLSIRLNALFRLIDRLQQGSDLDSTLGFVWEEFSQFLPMDWVAVLLTTTDGMGMKLERAYLEGQPDIAERRHFTIQGTPLDAAMASGEPMRMGDLFAADDGDGLSDLRGFLRSRGQHSAIFLPMNSNDQTSGMLVFASAESNAYTREHVELLCNIAHLVTHSFSKTVRLAEKTQLAAIGVFSSSIAHEVRNPLATISLALQYMADQEMSEGARKRIVLAAREAQRMETLLEDILRYAKPLKLKLEAMDLNRLVEGFLNDHADLTEIKRQRFQWSPGADPSPLMADRDRLIQVLLNLARNACEAAPENGVIRWSTNYDEGSRTVSLEVNNGGEPISPENLARLTAPFFTTRPRGTGLGLSIAKRVVETHGGELSISSDADTGTTVTVILPAGSQS